MTEDAIHLMRVFGLSMTTANKYLQAAHPERFIVDPTHAGGTAPGGPPTRRPAGY